LGERAGLVIFEGQVGHLFTVEDSLIRAKDASRIATRGE
jgi:hypothetical protein